MSRELKKLDKFQGRKGPVLLIILDGVGLGKQDESDGVYLAKMPCLDSLMKGDLYTSIKAHGTAVGMPSDEDMGNSEVGHNALGSGRIFDQGAALVKNAIADQSIYKTPTWDKLVSGAKQEGKAFHFIGLLSDGNVHSHVDHLCAMAKQCATDEVKKVRIHILTDGRDVYERSAVSYIATLENVLKEINENAGFDYAIASGGGRMLMTMDRYNADWAMVEKGWKTHVLGEGRNFKSATEAVETYYREDAKVNDQYLGAFVIERNGKPIGTIEDGDSVVFFNFRGDRAIELSMAFDQKEGFDKFDRTRVPNVLFAGMMEYDGDLHIPRHYLVNPPQIDKTISEYLCDEGVKSFAISETQKYGHVTYFWNGNKSGYINEALETFVEIPSDNIPFNQKPRMKACEITEKAIEMLKSGEYKFGRINFPNGDMVGHTGVEQAIIESLEVTDECMVKLIEVVKELDGVVMVLADHGNAEEMFKMKNGEKIVSTAHSLNPVPCAIMDSAYQGEYKMTDKDTSGLANVAATLLNLLGFEAPDDYEQSLIEFV